MAAVRYDKKHRDALFHFIDDAEVPIDSYRDVFGLDVPDITPGAFRPSTP